MFVSFNTYNPSSNYGIRAAKPVISPKFGETSSNGYNSKDELLLALDALSFNPNRALTGKDERDGRENVDILKQEINNCLDELEKIVKYLQNAERKLDGCMIPPEENRRLFKAVAFQNANTYVEIGHSIDDIKVCIKKAGEDKPKELFSGKALIDCAEKIKEHTRGDDSLLSGLTKAGVANAFDSFYITIDKHRKFARN